MPYRREDIIQETIKEALICSVWFLSLIINKIYLSIYLQKWILYAIVLADITEWNESSDEIRISFKTIYSGIICSHAYFDTPFSFLFVMFFKTTTFAIAFNILSKSFPEDVNFVTIILCILNFIYLITSPNDQETTILKSLAITISTSIFVFKPKDHLWLLHYSLLFVVVSKI